MKTKIFTLFVLLLATTALWAQRFQVGELYYEVSDIDGKMAEYFPIPKVNSPSTGKTTVVLFIPEDTPIGCYAVGTVNGWYSNDTTMKFTQVEGADDPRWVSYTFDYTEDMQIKVIAIPSDPAVAPDWSYQWGKNMDYWNDLTEDNVIILQGMGELVLENQGQPKLVGLQNGGVIYIHVKAWAMTPVIDTKPCETATIKHPFKTSKATCTLDDCDSHTNIPKKQIQSKKNVNNKEVHYVVMTYEDLSNNYSNYSKVKIPPTVEYEGITYQVVGISYNAFRNAGNIQTITIPENITTIGDDAFNNTPNLQTINFESLSPPQVTSNTFRGMNSYVNMYVPCGTTNSYHYVFNRNAQEYPAIYDIYVNEFGNGTAYVNKNTICGADISAYPYDGYYFSHWSDGNTDNHRVIELTQDSTLTAFFTISTNGQCGDNVYWSFANTKLSISGIGEMYDYDEDELPWILLLDSLKMVEIKSGVTSIGDNAFANATNLNVLTLPSTIEQIGKKTFANCRALYDIYSYTNLPPVAESSSFYNYNAYVHVPCEVIRYYQADMIWSNFKNLQCIASENVDTDDIIINPGPNSVTITWPTEDGADTYTIVIKKDDEVVCTLTFNADGQLLNIAFAPSRDGNHHAAQYAEMAANGGFRFTVTGLEQATHYAYNITAKDAANNTVATHNGEFTTQSTTAVENIDANGKADAQKLFRNGQLIIVKDGVEYNAMGQEL